MCVCVRGVGERQRKDVDAIPHFKHTSNESTLTTGNVNNFSNDMPCNNMQYYMRDCYIEHIHQLQVLLAECKVRFFYDISHVSYVFSYRAGKQIS